VRQGLYTIPSGTGFLKRLAEGLFEMADGDDFALTGMRVLLPTRRAGRELRDAFLTLSKGKPLLLPRLQPIGDVDAEEIELYLSGYGEIGFDIPPAISAIERQFLLAPLIQKKDPSLGLDAALSLATELARLIDTVHTEDLDFTGLQDIVPSTLATHWQKTLEFLEIITTYWPLILAERGQIDPADRRNRLLKSLATLWRDHPPETPIIAAGSTGSIPSAGELLKTIANLPQGVVILPGLDLDLDVDSWESITDTHPQATMRNLLNRMDKTRVDVTLWPEAEGHFSHRTGLIRSVMRPADSFGVTDKTTLSNGLKNLNIIETATPREEAAVIALAIRETLETPNKTACFVTPDRTLARRVMTALHRWGIEVDDSAGGALATTGSSTFLVSLLRVIEENFAPLELLDFLKHDYQRLIPKEDIAIFEKYILRGSRPAEGIAGLYRRLSIIEEKNKKLDAIVKTLDDCFASILTLKNNAYPLNEFCQGILEAAEHFSGGKEFFWSRSESNAISNFIAGVMGYADLLPTMELRIFGGVFRELLTAENYRSDDEPHRRILILGQLESRLINRDVMILGGLNEGTWPREAGHDPWMSRPMRQKFGLPPADRSTGLAAHDFAEHVSSETVFITRSLKSDGTATVPARWIQKLKTLLNAEGITTDWSNGNHYLQWVKQIDSPASATPLYAAIPEPRPPLHNRPQKLSATWVEKWMKNPYRVYAEKILKLRLLDPVDQDTLHAERGSFVHDVLLEFVQAYPHEMPDSATHIILEIGKRKLSDLENIATHWHYWWPRFERLVTWFVDEETKWRKDATPWIQEETGQVEIYTNPVTGRKFIITAKADRIDRIKAGGAAIMDYKTGGIPSLYKIKNGAAPQLPIESFILGQGGYKDTALEPKLMVYWKLSGSHSSAGEVKPLHQLDMSEIVPATEDGLNTLIRAFENIETPYIARASGGRLYDDEHAYAHLARTSEWSSGEREEDDADNGGNE
jgi:ATP-dependent helicase/nuclease subunit B